MNIAAKVTLAIVSSTIFLQCTALTTHAVVNALAHAYYCRVFLRVSQ
jgi:hypothetical protein